MANGIRSAGRATDPYEHRIQQGDPGQTLTSLFPLKGFALQRKAALKTGRITRRAEESTC